MPEISRFFGMVIAMYYNDHAPPHFPVRYGRQKAVIGIDPIALLAGRLSPKAHVCTMYGSRVGSFSPRSSLARFRRA